MSAFKIVRDDRIANKIIDLELKKYMWRTLDGSGNNMSNPNWGASNTPFIRKSYGAYTGNTISTTPNPRHISNLICKNNVRIQNSLNLTNMVWMWGQFLDHEITLTETDSADNANMTTPNTPEEDFSDRTIPFNRTKQIVNSNPREQANLLSCYIDGANVYGDNTTSNMELRRLDGSGKMKTSMGNNGEILLPYNVNSFPNARTTSSTFFLAGDVRSNENVGLIALHTLFVREHNRLCDQIILNPKYNSDELIFQQARRIVIGYMQNITYKEFLPKLLGNNFIDEYTGYNPLENPSIANEFSAVGFRLGHTMIPSQIAVAPNTLLPLRDLFFKPNYITTHGIDNVLRASSLNIMDEIDGTIVEDLRSFLFDSPTATILLDLPALNIQRGRDHGIPKYNVLRNAYGLNSRSYFYEITSNVNIAQKLALLYATPDDIDPWIGAIVEDRLPNMAVGELLSKILTDQFTRLRDGDRFWYKNDPGLTENEIANIQAITLADIINRNTSVNVPSNVFKV